MNWYNVLLVLSGSIVLLPVITGLFVVRNAPQYIKVFYVFICFTFLFDVVSTSMAMNGIHNLWMVKLYMLIEFAFFSWFLNWSMKQSIWPVWVIALVLSGAVLIWLFASDSNSVYSYFALYVLILSIVQSFWVIGFSAFLNTDLAFYRFIIWLLMGRFVSSVILLFVFGLSTKFYFDGQSPDLGNFRGALNSCANIAINSMYAFALLWRFQSRKSI